MPKTERPPGLPVVLGSAIVALLLTLAGAAVRGGATADDDTKLAAYGRHLAQECTSCHRIDGISNGIPSIIGWSPDAFEATLKFYKDGARTNPVMVSVAGSLSDQQVKALATYFSSLPKPSPRLSPPAADKKAKR